MGKGDIKTRRGKIIAGSYGVLRKRRKRNAYVPPVAEKKVAREEKIEQVVDEEIKSGLAEPKKVEVIVKVEKEVVEAPQKTEQSEKEAVTVKEEATEVEEKPKKKVARKKSPAKKADDKEENTEA